MRTWSNILDTSLIDEKSKHYNLIIDDSLNAYIKAKSAEDFNAIKHYEDYSKYFDDENEEELTVVFKKDFAPVDKTVFQIATAAWIVVERLEKFRAEYLLKESLITIDPLIEVEEQGIYYIKVKVLEPTQIEKYEDICTFSEYDGLTIKPIAYSKLGIDKTRAVVDKCLNFMERELIN